MIILTGGTPWALAKAIQQIAPELLTAHNPHQADVLITPRWTDEYASEANRATRDAWCDMWWAHPTIVINETTADPYPDRGWERCTHIGTIGAPPRIPIEQRIAQAPPVTTTHISDAQAAMHGGREKLTTDWTAQRDRDFARDTSVNAYDWPVLARTIVDRIRDLGTPPTLTPGQRTHVAAVRLLDALRAVPAARQSLDAHLSNASQAGEHDAADVVRALLPIIDPVLQEAN